MHFKLLYKRSKSGFLFYRDDLHGFLFYPFFGIKLPGAYSIGTPCISGHWVLAQFAKKPLFLNCGWMSPKHWFFNFEGFSRSGLSKKHRIHQNPLLIRQKRGNQTKIRTRPTLGSLHMKFHDCQHSLPHSLALQEIDLMQSCTLSDRWFASLILDNTSEGLWISRVLLWTMFIQKWGVKAAESSCSSPAFRTTYSFHTYPFVRIHNGKNSKIIFFCICICNAIKIMSKTILICYVKTAKNNCVCICYENLVPKQCSSVSVSVMKRIINSKIIFLCLWCQDFLEELQSLPSRTYPSEPDPSEPPPPPGPNSDPILTRFGPEKADFRSESCQNQVKIGSDSGLEGGGRRGSGPEG